ncbi:amino acid/amide ABC transporter ATP-binding protein 1, HAAT family [Thermaerobacter marianensis DSM 12885]|uniref:Amino acid/amide ABC transporter ATP-binding protein 1, HAAT family n=1 Tax=Thermaerobacter marianensis (strain ATCC 700841 / DSM 12885 / JCM 10246 / 7p75a) TaxID=644966 RepID=E6SI10_THEM7|nr:ABC transporter ATP-binding protein [Thermaerobacter marianensis]ADU51890.1 amino acid/amide ABC transporter ATP-binding protein 1, HAAT family [Thermaerobacter marianensis DSM 12885]
MEALRVEGVSKAVAGVRILENVSLTVRQGERRAIIGPNGAGKTTLFRIVAGELAPTAGRIFFFGEEMTRLPAYRRARRGLIRTFQQTSAFFELTVLENVLLVLLQGRHRLLGMGTLVHRDRATLERALAVLQEWGLADCARQQVRHLPYGLQRRLELALAFVARPRVLLMDEPTAGLAASDLEEIAERLGRIPRDVTVVFIDHNMKAVFSVADRITVLHHGQLLAEGTPEEIRDNPAIQAAYLGSVTTSHA